MKRKTKKLGIRTNGTIKRNKFDRKYTISVPIIYHKDSPEIRYSINKQGNWKFLKNINVQRLIYHEIKYDRPDNYKDPTMTYRNPDDYGGGGPFGIVKSGRNIDVVIGCGEWIVELPFKKTQYPLYREYRNNYYTYCKPCFWHDGRIWQLKGLGKKSKNKTKGMKKQWLKDHEL